jgi:uncharacterized protein YdaU (DUF1376 family)
MWRDKGGLTVKAPCFKLWAAETLREMRWMTPEQRGYLFALLCEAWLSEPKGYIPMNRDMIWKMAGADSKEKFEASSGPVLELFEQAGERYWYRKLVDQDENIRQVSQSRSDAGKSGARSRWQSHNAEDGKSHNTEDGKSHNTEDGKSHNTEDGKSHNTEDGKLIADLDVDTDIDTEKTNTSCAKPQSGSAPAPTRSALIIDLPLNDKTEHSVYEADVAEYGKLYPAVDISQQLRNMRGWLLSNPRNRKTRDGIKRFIAAWLQKEQNKAPVESKRPSGTRNGAAYRSGDASRFDRKPDMVF